MMHKHASIDVETLDNTPTSAIVQIGVYTEDDIAFKVNIDFADAIKYGTVGGDTLKWWLKQSKEAQESITESGYSLPNALQELTNFIKMENITHLWAHATFDFPILTAAYKEAEMRVPWDFRNLRDIRTLEHYAGSDIEWEDREGTHHDALDDAMFQMKHITKMNEFLKGKIL